MPNTNTFSTSDVIPRLLAQGLLALRQMAITPRFVNRDYELLAGEKGSTVDVNIPSAITAQDVTPSNTPPDDAGVVPTKVALAMDNWKEAPFFLSDKDMLEVMNGVIPMQASEAVKAIANAVDNSILALYKGVYGYAGTAGTTPYGNDLGAFLTADQILNDQLAPMEPRVHLINAKAKANAMGLRAFQDASYRGDAAGIMKGDIGEKLGAFWAMNQNMPRHTAGTITTGLITKAATVVAAGATSFVATTAASTGACALLQGDIINIAGHNQTYAVGANVTQASAATDTAAISITPGLEFALAGSEAVTVKSSHRVNLLMHRDAIALATRPFSGADPMGLGTYQSAVDPISGLTLRLEVTRQHKRTRFAYDMLWGTKLIRAALATRVAGE